MTKTLWLPGARQVRDLSHFVTNGKFAGGRPDFVVMHVNVGHTPITAWGPNNPNSVTPNFQIDKDGAFDQMLPMDQQPWCQIAGNFRGAAVEMEGFPSEPCTDAQIETFAKIMRVYHRDYGVPLHMTDDPHGTGLSVHYCGGIAWGGHTCPGPGPRAAQRADILRLARQPKGLHMDAEVTAAFAELKAENAQLSKDVAQLHNHLQHLFADSQGRTHRLRTWLGWQDGKGSLDAPSDVTHKQGQRA